MSLDNEYILVLPIENINEGDTWEKGSPIPLHCTIMHWFKMMNHDYLKFWLNYICEKFESPYIELVGQYFELFGPNNDVKVTTVKKTTELIILHNRILQILFSMIATEMKEFGYIGAGYQPHVSEQAHAKLLLDQRIKCSKLALIRKNKDGTKEVMSIYTFQK